MLLTVSKVTLGPILLAQGYYTRKITPVLPEPQGERQGRVGTGQALKLLILGDSAAAGVGVDSQQEALSGQLLSLLAPHFDLHWQLQAKTGHKTQDLLDQLMYCPQMQFDAVITSVGVNDVTSQVSPRLWLQQQERFLDLIQTRFLAPHVFITSVPPMHQFPALPQPLRWYIGSRAKAFNKNLKRLVAAKTYCTLLEADLSLSPSVMAIDGFHPGPAVYTRWAECVAGEIMRRFG